MHPHDAGRGGSMQQPHHPMMLVGGSLQPRESRETEAAVID